MPSVPTTPHVIIRHPLHVRLLMWAKRLYWAVSTPVRDRLFSYTVHARCMNSRRPTEQVHRYPRGFGPRTAAQELVRTLQRQGYFVIVKRRGPFRTKTMTVERFLGVW